MRRSAATSRPWTLPVQASRDRATADQASRDRAAADQAAVDAKAKADAEAKQRAADAAAAKKAAADAARAEDAKKGKGSYEKVSARTFKKIIKDADSYKGKKYLVYGVVAQFDSATGEDTFRADVDSSPHSESYEYNENAVVTTDDVSMLKDVVQDDFVTMYVEVAGSISYDTQIGGNTTAPHFKVNLIQVTGSSS